MNDLRRQFTDRVPSLREHLGAEPSGAGFEAWVATLLQIQQGGLPPAEAQFLRLLGTFSVACVEQMNREAAIDGSPQGISDALSLWSRAAGFATVMALASVSKPDAPLRSLGRMLAEDFKVGAKIGADAAMRDASHG